MSTQEFMDILKLKIFVLLSIFLISMPAKSGKDQSTNHDSITNQKIKVIKDFDDDDNLLKQIDSAREKLKSEELRLEDIQNRIIKRRLNNSK